MPRTHKLTDIRFNALAVVIEEGVSYERATEPHQMDRFIYQGKKLAPEHHNPLKFLMREGYIEVDEDGTVVPTVKGVAAYIER